MSFFENITEKAKMYANIAAEKAKDVAEVAADKAKDVNWRWAMPSAPTSSTSCLSSECPR